MGASTAPEKQQRLLPTTRPQVAGYRFMRRRVEHGLVFGDIRMIHDPLGTRRRAMLFGVAAVAIIAAVMGLLAWLRPNADPGDAPILRSGDANLYVRVGETLHPVTNLTSARLIAGEPADPVRIGEANLAQRPRGVPVGLVTAPSHFAPADSADTSWSVCHSGDSVTVAAGEPARALAADRAVFTRAGGAEWLVTHEGRALLPPSDEPAGRVVRRGLGLDADTPVWEPPVEVLNALREMPQVALPSPLPEVVDTGEGVWLRTADRGVQEITPVQRDILADAGALVRRIERGELANYPDASPPIDVHLPTVAPAWVDPSNEAVCVNDSRGAASEPPPPTTGTTELSGGAVATHFAGLADGAVAVDTGHGYHIVSTHGLRHHVPDSGTLEVIGAQHMDTVAWEILSLLPEGDVIEREAALTATY
ncbi:type VII secretion protein EccB [Corynebacterium sp. LK2510]|uniref:type VII secretion protein EccB n=1 Tax=Corynebacterium sp. LK2510 TaxID=3110472 RepID=UPI0034CE9D8D